MWAIVTEEQPGILDGSSQSNECAPKYVIFRFIEKTTTLYILNNPIQADHVSENLLSCSNRRQ